MKVRFTLLPQRDLQRIHSYISKDSPEAASRVVTRLIELARLLADHPYEGRETDEPNVRVTSFPGCAILSSTVSPAMKFTSRTFVTQHEIDLVYGVDSGVRNYDVLSYAASARISA